MNRATYSAEEDKLRLYVGRVPRDEYETLRAAGFVSTPKQDCDFVAVWTPQREDLALGYLDDDQDIEDEDYSPVERAADRAERFDGYREKRTDEATGLADTFEAGPQVFGHQNQRRAERQAARHDRSRVRAVSQWSKAEYWQSRTEGVISHAMFKARPDVRRGRILTLESAMRRTGAGRWRDHLAHRLAYELAMLANEGGMAGEAEMEPGGWIRGVRTVSWCEEIPRTDWHQIQGVNNSPATGRITSVKLQGFFRSEVAERNGKPIVVSVSVERLGEGCYRPPTDEERAAFTAKTKADKAEAKASKPKGPPLINPTDKDAERLQAIWNERAAAAHKLTKSYGEPPQATVRRMTQAEYSAASKGSYSRCSTSNISEQLRERGSSAMGREICGRVTVFQVRTCSVGGFSMHAPGCVIVLTDKPQKPLPWEEVEAAVAEQPTEESLLPLMGEIYKLSCMNWLPSKDEQAMQLISDASYVGWWYTTSMTQFGLTEKGQAAHVRWNAEQTIKQQATLFEEGPTTELATGTLYHAPVSR